MSVVDEQPAASLWKALDYLLRRRTYLLAFRRFRRRPRRPVDLPGLTPGLGKGIANRLVQLLVRARLLKRLEPDGAGQDSRHVLTAKGRRLLDILQTELRRLDAFCRKSGLPAGRSNDRGELRGVAWVIRRLLRQRGAMALLARMPAEEFVGEQFVSWVKNGPRRQCQRLPAPADVLQADRALPPPARASPQLPALRTGPAGTEPAGDLAVAPAVVGKPALFFTEAELKTV